MTITLTELIDIVMLESGQFITGDIDNININKNRFYLIVKRALGYYDKYKPVSRRETVYADNGIYIFPNDDAPEWISKVYPVGLSNPFMLAFQGTSFDNFGSNSAVTLVYRYTKPRLIVNNGFQIEILGHYNRKPEIEYETDGKTIREVTIEGISLTDQNFFDLVKGYFLVALGKSRRAFTIADFPVTSDSDEMISEGEDLIESASDSIKDTNSWYYAVGG